MNDRPDPIGRHRFRWSVGRMMMFVGACGLMFAIAKTGYLWISLYFICPIVGAVLARNQRNRIPTELLGGCLGGFLTAVAYRITIGIELFFHPDPIRSGWAAHIIENLGTMGIILGFFLGGFVWALRHAIWPTE